MFLRLRRTVRRYPIIRNSMRRLYRFGQYNAARLLGKLRQDEYRLLDVDPLLIHSTVNLDDVTLKGNQVWHFGTVSDGDWDMGGESLRAYNQVYSITHQRFVENRPYEAIAEYQDHLTKIEKGAFLDGCSTSQQYRERWNELDNLFRSIQRLGYKTQSELGTENPLDEIRVQIGRKGQILLEEGLHRLVIAQILGLPSIPVLVTRRHTQWAALREAVIKIVVQRGFIHQPFNHPDLDVIPQLYGNYLNETSMYGNERWGYIVDSLPIKSGRVLDIGSYFGYFPHRLEDLGFECVALEPDPENLVVMRCYRDMLEKRFEIWEKSLFDLDDFEYDIVVALNIFHHLVRTQDDHDRLVEFLTRLNCKFMYFEPDPNQNQKAYKHFTDEKFVQFVLEHSCLQESHYLGQTREGRGLYLLSAVS